MTNIKLALRSLIKTPFVTTVAVVSLALGIGANTAIFSMFDTLLLQALPVSSPEELVSLEAPGPKPGGTSCNQAGDCDAVFSHPMFRDLEQSEPEPFSRASPPTGLFGVEPRVPIGTNPERRRHARLRGATFQLLGLNPALGRLLGLGRRSARRAGTSSRCLGHTYWENSVRLEDPDVV